MHHPLMRLAIARSLTIPLAGLAYLRVVMCVYSTFAACILTISTISVPMDDLAAAAPRIVTAALTRLALLKPLCPSLLYESRLMR